MSSNNQRGFSAVLLVLVFVIIGALVFAGLRVRNNQANDAADQSQQEAPTISNSDDLEAAENFLDQTDIDGQLDTTDIDTALTEQ